MAVQSDIRFIDVAEETASDLTDMVGEYYAEMAETDADMYGLKEDWRSNWEQCLSEWRTATDHWAILAVAPEGPVGFIMFCINTSRIWRLSRRGYISDIYLKASHRKTGSGKALLQVAIDTLRQAGAQRIDLTVHRAKESSIRFWEATGFRPFMSRMTMLLNQQDLP